MNIETTINVRSDLLEKILEKRDTDMTNLNSIIEYLLKKAMAWSRKKLVSFKSVQYQKKAVDSVFYYHRLHIALPEDLYEKCLDMRKLYKMSVSLILATCIEHYLHEVDKAKPADNYPANYLILTSQTHQIDSFTVFSHQTPPKHTITAIKQIVFFTASMKNKLPKQRFLSSSHLSVDLSIPLMR